MTDDYKRILIDGVKHYGQHMMLTATGCNSDLEDTDKVAEFLKTLVTEIDMVAYGEPLVARFGEGIEVGISGVQLIETSAISLHTNDLARDLYLDVFSCKEYSNQDVIMVVDAFFAPAKHTYETVFRK